MQTLVHKIQSESEEAAGRLVEDSLMSSRFQLLVRSLFHRLEAQVENLPRFVATGVAATVIAGFAGYGVILSGQVDKLSTYALGKLGFDVELIEITGNHFMRGQDVLDVLGIQPSLSLLTFDVRAAKQTLLREPWVNTASVRKIYPDILQIKLKERQPFAVWQRDHKKYLIDSEGRILDDFDPHRRINLALLVGQGANKKGATILAVLNEFPNLARRVQAMQLISDRRWDLQLDNRITVKLPEKHVRAALNELSLLDGENDLLSKDVSIIDMRLPDRLVMRLSDAALAEHQTRIEQIKANKLRGKSI